MKFLVSIKPSKYCQKPLFFMSTSRNMPLSEVEILIENRLFFSLNELFPCNKKYPIYYTGTICVKLIN